ncbi:hypothetical protein BDY19DRAFT_975784 [Irpex rosettiformis]|uniref:Uncharacterized protein n=1 Tax=Irpex rosettiformis TaxID=378272 RepID=A0ACB8TNZ0_9APHY|nr:hypothetical protein BDY19DRAFT_975784 [Irpex rosettiformis]
MHFSSSFATLSAMACIALFAYTPADARPLDTVVARRTYLTLATPTTQVSTVALVNVSTAPGTPTVPAQVQAPGTAMAVAMVTVMVAASVTVMATALVVGAETGLVTDPGAGAGMVMAMGRAVEAAVEAVVVTVVPPPSSTWV